MGLGRVSRKTDAYAIHKIFICPEASVLVSERAETGGFLWPLDQALTGN